MSQAGCRDCHGHGLSTQSFFSSVAKVGGMIQGRQLSGDLFSSQVRFKLHPVRTLQHTCEIIHLSYFMSILGTEKGIRPIIEDVATRARLDNQNGCH